MTDAQQALAQVREALEKANDASETIGEAEWYREAELRAVCGKAMLKGDREFIAACSPANMTAILDHIEAQAAEIEQLREMLARLYAGSALYCDDGELQDGRASPFIDFKRDSVADIRSAMVERGEQR